MKYLAIILLGCLIYTYNIGAKESISFHPMPTLSYLSESKGIYHPDRVHPVLRFLIISIGAFPISYLLTFPIILISTQQKWSTNRQITTSLLISSGISLGVALIDMIWNLSANKEQAYEAI